MDWFSDLGGDPQGNLYPAFYSVTQILAAAQKSGMLGVYPRVHDTSDVRSFSDGYSFHFTHNAMDFGNESPNGSPEMDQFASWLDQHFGPYSLEIIHLNQDRATSIEWKYGTRRQFGWYGMDTLNGHLGHVHWAITLSGLAAAGMETDMAQVPHVNANGPLDMAHWKVRVIQGLLQAHGGMISVHNTDKKVLLTVAKWFQQQAGLVADGDCGPVTGQHLLMQLGNEH